jgi:hypothetical protein
MLLQLLYKWQQQSLKLWIQPRIHTFKEEFCIHGAQLMKQCERTVVRNTASIITGNGSFITRIFAGL